MGWKYGAGAGLLKSRGWYFSYLIFSRFIIFKFRNYFILCKIALYVALCYHNFMKKSHLKLSKNERKNIPYKLRFISLFVKGFKKLKIDFWSRATVELVKSPFWYLFEPRKGWLVGLGQEGFAWWWGVCVKSLGGGTEKSGGGAKISGRRNKLSQVVAALKAGEGWNSLTNYALSFHTVFQVFKVLKNLLDSATVTFSSQVLTYIFIHSNPHPHTLLTARTR